MKTATATDSLIQALLNPSSYGHGVYSVEVIETHISWVLLAGPYAYKIKKPVQLPFLDFSTLERRHHFCTEELRLNRRLAPELYLEVLAICGPRENPTLGGTSPIEYAVKMRQFPAGARLDRQLKENRVSREAVEVFADQLAVFHHNLPAAAAADPYGEPERIADRVLENFAETRRYLAEALQPGEAVHERTLETSASLRSMLARRKLAGAIKEGHGDLHLENLVQLEGRIVPFDALEFDPQLRWADVMDEAGFLVMDLMAHGRSDLAFVFLNRYLESTGDYAGLPVLGYYLLYRALVRAKVRAIKSLQEFDSDPEASPGPYLALARALVRAPAPLLAVTHGLSGSGKTTVTEALIPCLPAIRIRSDTERKRLFGLEASQRSASDLGEGLYSPKATEHTYAALEDCARLGLRAGLSVLVDAAFLRRKERARFLDLARSEQAPFAILRCVAPEPELRRRVSAREAAGCDASEATLEVLDHQLTVDEALDQQEARHVVTADTATDTPVKELVRQIRACGIPHA